MSAKTVTSPRIAIDIIYTKGACEPDNDGLKKGLLVPATTTKTSLDFKLESERLKSFTNWTSDAVTPEQLAKAGFYYLNHSDAVKCAFCKVEGCRWEKGDDPMEDHSKWSPNCPFIRKNQEKPGMTNDCQTGGGSSNNRDVCGNLELLQTAGLPEGDATKILKKIGYIKPCSFPQYTTFESRMGTFQDWPKSLKQKPNSLAQAGFFYKGIGDQTLCFHCAGGLKDWEDDDDPWEQHALWFPKCSFLVLSKGQEYVQKVQNKFNSQEASGSEGEKVEDPSAALQKTLSSSSSSTKEAAGESTSTSDEETTQKSKDDSCTTLCKICYKNELGVIFIPCGHVLSCVECSMSLNNICPICRKPFEATVRAFLS